MTFWTYILKCADNSYYTGHTDNLERRIQQHHQRAFPTCYTARRLPVEMVFSQAFATREEALASERQIKGWSRKKKEAMIAGDWARVSALAENALRRASLRQAQGERVPRQAQDERGSAQ
jgi:predicted GIY-YIG superfamily endonuclease